MTEFRTKKALKAAEDAAYLARVVTVLASAHEAAEVAAKSFIEQAPKTPEGFVRDTCGGASVIIYKPSYRFRKALESLGEIRKGYRGAWSISHFTRNVHSQSIQANESAARAARLVLERGFPEEPSFYDQSYID